MNADNYAEKRRNLKYTRVIICANLSLYVKRENRTGYKKSSSRERRA